MGYKVIFLNMEDYPFLSEDECSCEVCKELNRNVIEPVVLFVDENEDIENLSEERIRELIEENKRLLGQTKSTCIFHCEKENEVWIENIEVYRQYRLRQREAIEKKLPFNEESPAKWRGNLVDIFWERIRVYRFAVDYADELTDEARKILEENEEIKKNKDLLRFYLERCKEENYYDFRQIIFPAFQKEIDWEDFKNIEVIEEEKENKTKYHLKYLENLNFWHRSETKKFKNNAYFEETQFSDNVDFRRIQFLGKASFRETQFSGKADFERAQFSGATNFLEAQFSGKTRFWKAQFLDKADFGRVQFSGKTNFWYAQFSGKTRFWEAQFSDEADFGRVQFSGEACFLRAQFTGGADFREAQFSDEADFGRVQFSGEANFNKARFLCDVIFSYTKFENNAVFDNTEFLTKNKSHKINFERVKFKSLLQFKDATFNSYADFNNAEFHGNVFFNKLTANADINFQRVNFKNRCVFTGSVFKFNANFTDVRWEREEDGKIVYSKAEFNNCEFEKAIFENVKFGETFFRHARFSGKANFSEAKFMSKADFLGSKFLVKVTFWGAQFLDKVIFGEAQFWDKVKFGEVQFSGEAYFGEAQFSGEAYFGKSQFLDKVNFGETRFLDKVKFGGARFLSKVNFWKVQFSDRVTFCGARFENIILFVLTDDNKAMDFSHIKYSIDSHIEIRNLKTKRLVMNNFSNYAKEFLFFDLELLSDEKNNEPNLEIKNSILNKMRFINCDFSKGEKIKIEDSSIASCEFVNVKWGNIAEKRICPELFEKEPSKAQDIYRQLKLAHDNQKDFIHGGDFYALEMRAYDKYLDSLSWLEHFKDKIVFKISKFASNYAQDWWLVLKWIYSIVIAMTVLVYIDSSRIIFGNNYFKILLFTILLAVNLVIFSKKARWWFKFLFLMCYFSFLNFLAYSNFDIRLFFDDFFITLGKSLYPIKTVLNGDKNHQHIPLYKTFFGLGWIALSYLIYQLVVSLRRKIRR